MMGLILTPSLYGNYFHWKMIWTGPVSHLSPAVVDILGTCTITDLLLCLGYPNCMVTWYKYQLHLELIKFRLISNYNDFFLLSRFSRSISWSWSILLKILKNELLVMLKNITFWMSNFKISCFSIHHHNYLQYRKCIF